MWVLYSALGSTKKSPCTLSSHPVAGGIALCCGSLKSSPLNGTKRGADPYRGWSRITEWLQGIQWMQRAQPLIYSGNSTLAVANLQTQLQKQDLLFTMNKQFCNLVQSASHGRLQSYVPDHLLHLGNSLFMDPPKRNSFTYILWY